MPLAYNYSFKSSYDFSSYEENSNNSYVSFYSNDSLTNNNYGIKYNQEDLIRYFNISN